MPAPAHIHLIYNADTNFLFVCNSHSYSSTTTKAATCTASGVKTYTCNTCHYSYTETIAALGHNYTYSVTKTPTTSAAGQLTGTCSVCDDSYVDSYTDATGHTWTDGHCECGAYILQHVGATLTLEAEVKYNLYFYLNDPSIKISNVGLLTYLTEPTEANLTNADYVLHNMFFDQRLGYYALSTQGVPAKEMGDTMYLRLYVELEDGSVIYGKLIPYSAKTYATSILERSSDVALKKTVMALMNYGAEAQKLKEYKTDELMNEGLSYEQIGYDADLLNGVVSATDAKKGSLIATEGAFTTKLAGVTMTGSLAINYYFLPGKTVDNGTVTMYYWSPDTYASVEELTLDNADGSTVMTLNNGYYEGLYEGIAAKDIDKTVYVLAVYESEGETCMSGIVSYSIEYFCRRQVAGATSNQAMCEALTIYSYYAKLYFNVG